MSVTTTGMRGVHINHWVCVIIKSTAHDGQYLCIVVLHAGAVWTLNSVPPPPSSLQINHSHTLSRKIANSDCKTPINARFENEHCH